jgi:hypothetical protein
MTRHTSDASSLPVAKLGGWWRMTPWLMFLTALLARFIYVSLYAGSIPFWDQWDAEADGIFLPWLNGTWHWSSLFNAHNEHRIVLTRLLSLALFELNHQQWDNLVEAYAGAVVFAAVEAMLYARLCLGLPHLAQRFGLLAFMVLLAALPFAWENFVCGFQSQFYFMALLAISMQSVAAFGINSMRDLLLLMVLGAISLFTMASGLIACLAVIPAVATRLWSKAPPSRYFAICLFVCMMFIAAIGMALIPSVPANDSLKAHGLTEHVSALSFNLAWPWQPNAFWRWKLAIVFLWLPTLVWIIRALRRRDFDRSDAFAAGMLAWVGLQFLAIAHARGHDTMTLSSRYMDITAIGIILNAYLALTQLSINNHRFPGWAVAVMFFSITLLGLAERQNADMNALLERHTQTLAETLHVRDYLATGNPINLQQPRLYIPYPDAAHLQSWLDNPAVRTMLPRLTHQDYYSAQGLGWLSVFAMKSQALFALSPNYPSAAADSLHQPNTSPTLH